MTDELLILSLSAVSIAFFHTLLGPDHYLPFVMMAKAKKWSILKTVGITFLCGAGHVASSLILGGAGIALGLAATALDIIESARGEIAAWALIAFGMAYFIWGLKKALKNRPHSHWHNHGNGSTHRHEHVHKTDHSHLHEESGEKSMTPWILFVIFILGPCELLIPLLMYPAATNSLFEVIWVSSIFCVVTIATMLLVVTTLLLGINKLRFGRFEKFSHSIAGATICVSGMAIYFLGL